MPNYKGISIGIIAKIGIPPPTVRKLSPDPRPDFSAMARGCSVAKGSVSGSTGMPRIGTLLRNADDGDLLSSPTDDRTSPARARPVDGHGPGGRHRYRFGSVQEADASRAERADVRLGHQRLGALGLAGSLRRTVADRGHHPLPARRRELRVPPRRLRPN